MRDAESDRALALTASFDLLTALSLSKDIGRQ